MKDQFKEYFHARLQQSELKSAPDNIFDKVIQDPRLKDKAFAPKKSASANLFQFWIFIRINFYLYRPFSTLCGKIRHNKYFNIEKDIKLFQETLNFGDIFKSFALELFFLLLDRGVFSGKNRHHALAGCIQYVAE